MSTHVILLAAGRGSRLRSKTDHIPKILIDLSDGKTLLEHHLDSYKGTDITDVTIVVGYKHSVIKGFLTELSDLTVNISLVFNPMWGRADNLVSLYMGMSSVLNSRILSPNFSMEYDDVDAIVIQNGDTLLTTNAICKVIKSAHMSGLATLASSLADPSRLDALDCMNICIDPSKDKYISEVSKSPLSPGYITEFESPGFCCIPNSDKVLSLFYGSLVKTLDVPEYYPLGDHWLEVFRTCNVDGHSAICCTIDPIDWWEIDIHIDIKAIEDIYIAKCLEVPDGNKSAS